MTKFDQKRFSTPANSQKYRDNFDAVFGKKDDLRCLVTKNPCGTDTQEITYPCLCKNCQIWLSRR